MTATSCVAWSVGKTKLPIHALKSAPWAKQLQQVFDMTEEWLLGMMNGQRSASRTRQEIDTELRDSVITHEQRTEQIQESVRKKSNK
ncbi:hypothetical protein HO173_004800 [Letharia columbiana]|uniref:Uncharacterized protein n=1 Tax=Letharia columbiana TaxID=112416 RepID=A0A8H6L6D6_9LECA|nr:uncharacterized protein HO173_004800 [Letharia columbiana]KAF6237330.1 hypothetical protein HO173_004800 [Letharia columbiana]